jgi:hypothetical protein
MINDTWSPKTRLPVPAARRDGGEIGTGAMTAAGDLGPTGQHAGTQRAAGGFGLLAVALLIAGDAMGTRAGEPGPGASAATYGRWLDAHPFGPSQWAGAYLEVLGLCAFLLFFPALSAVLRRTRSEWSWLATAALGAGLVSTAVKLASGPIAIVAVDGADGGLSPAVQKALVESNGWSFVLTSVVDGTFLIAAGALILAARGLPRRLGGAALGFGPLAILSALGGSTARPACFCSSSGSSRPA